MTTTQLLALARHLGLFLIFWATLWFASDPQFDGRDIVAIAVMVISTLGWMELQARARYQARHRERN